MVSGPQGPCLIGLATFCCAHGDELCRRAPASNGEGQVLDAFVQVGHRAAVGIGVELHLVDLLAGLLVEDQEDGGLESPRLVRRIFGRRTLLSC